MDMGKAFFALAFAAAALASPAGAAASVPTVIGYGGVLHAEGECCGYSFAAGGKVTFRLYGSAEATAAVWEEEHTDVSVDGGFFHAYLGSGGSPLAASLFTQELWLEVELEGVGKLSPRTRLASVPYAMSCGEAERLGGKGAGEFVTGGQTDSVTGAMIKAGEVTDDKVVSVSWAKLTGVPEGFADGKDNDTTYLPGDGLVLEGTTFSAAFEAVGGDGGSSKTVARGDHSHGALYLAKDAQFGGDVTGTYGGLSLGSGVVGTGNIAAGAVTAAKIGEPCKQGEVLQKGAGGWGCGALPAVPGATPGVNVLLNPAMTDLDGDLVPDYATKTVAEPANYVYGPLSVADADAILGGSSGSDAVEYASVQLRGTETDEASVSFATRIRPGRESGVEVTCSVYVRRVSTSATLPKAKMACFGTEVVVSLPDKDTAWRRMSVSARVAAAATKPARLAVWGSGDKTGGDSAMIEYALPKVEYGGQATSFNAGTPLETESQRSVPVGAVIDWWRPDGTFPVPEGFQVCDGSTVTDARSPFKGKALPDLKDRFVRGVTDPAGIGAAGGAEAHGHVASASMEGTADHQHLWFHAQWYPWHEWDCHSGDWQTIGFFVSAIEHPHAGGGGATGNSCSLPGAGAEGSPQVSLNTSSAGAHSHPASATVSDSQALPPYVGLLKLMRVW
jgi:hypothetical protein